MMYCPLCNSDTKVIDSRYHTNYVRRRRKCDKCSHRFSTIEKNVEADVTKLPDRQGYFIFVDTMGKKFKICDCEYSFKYSRDSLVNISIKAKTVNQIKD